jgi:hypothetical protein
VSSQRRTAEKRWRVPIRILVDNLKSPWLAAYANMEDVYLSKTKKSDLFTKAMLDTFVKIKSIWCISEMTKKFSRDSYRKELIGIMTGLGAQLQCNRDDEQCGRLMGFYQNQHHICADPAEIRMNGGRQECPPRSGHFVSCDRATFMCEDE